MTGDVCAVTLVVGGVEGALCSEASPVVAHGLWCQVFLTSRQLESLENGVEGLLVGTLLSLSHLILCPCVCVGGKTRRV